MAKYRNCPFFLLIQKSFELIKSLVNQELLLMKLKNITINRMLKCNRIKLESGIKFW